MIVLGSSLTHAPIMSLQTGTELARTSIPVIDPASLAIIAYQVTGPFISKDMPTLLRIADVRELSNLRFIIDSGDEFVHPDDIIKLQEIYHLGFTLVGIAVVNEKRHKLGKVVDFTIETGGFIIQQITVRRPFLKSFNDTELIIHRSQIIEITDTAIVVHSQAKVPEPELHEVVGSYINPFRKSDPAAGSIDVSKH